MNGAMSIRQLVDMIHRHETMQGVVDELNARQQRHAIRTAEAALDDIDAILARALVRPRQTLWQRIWGWLV